MPQISSNELFDYIIAGVKSDTKLRQWVFQSLLDWPRRRDEAYKNYADALGKPPLTENEKKQALLNYMLEESE